jgi:hypothetical protein
MADLAGLHASPRRTGRTMTDGVLPTSNYDVPRCPRIRLRRECSRREAEELPMSPVAPHSPSPGKGTSTSLICRPPGRQIPFAFPRVSPRLHPGVRPAAVTRRSRPPSAPRCLSWSAALSDIECRLRSGQIVAKLRLSTTARGLRRSGRRCVLHLAICAALSEPGRCVAPPRVRRFGAATADHYNARGTPPAIRRTDP